MAQAPVTWDSLVREARDLTDDELRDYLHRLPPDARQHLLASASDARATTPASPLALASRLFDTFSVRPHLEYLNERIVNAVADVEAGRSRRLIIEMPPRAGKTTLATLLAAAWTLARHPNWPMALTSHDGTLATGWGRQIRRWVEEGRLGPGVSVARDAGAAGEWETTAGGKVLSVSLRESFTGRGAKVLIVDDPHKDFVEAHSKVSRENVWGWWLSVAQTRLEPPSLVIVVMTRWHEDDFVGRLLSKETEGDPNEWEVIRLPALAEAEDVLGRAEGDPLLSPLLAEDDAAAVARWSEVRVAVGEYVWAAMYLQRPSPARGAIFDTSWWRYWTHDPALASEDGRVVYLNPAALSNGRWVDSWDCAFKATDTSDYVVGQRWVKVNADRYLIAQQRGRWTFTETLVRMRAWGDGQGPYGRNVHQRLIEEKANGAAIIDVLRRQISGLKPVNPQVGKEARARAITPEVESGNVYLPHPREAPWVADLLSELRNFPHDVHDDQVDALTQALSGLRDAGRGHATVPGRVKQIDRNVARAANTTKRNYK